MNKQERFDSQAQIDKTHCAKPAKLSRRERYWYRLKLRRVYRDLTGRIKRDYLLTSDTLGHTVLIFLRALRISIEIADRIAPWADMHEIDQAAARIKLTRDNVGYVIGRGIGLTFEDRERFKAWAFYPDISPEEFEERNAVERNTKRNKKKRDNRAERAAQIKATSRDPREAIVLTVIDRIVQRPGPTVISNALIRNAMSKAEREAFPVANASFRWTVNRVIRRLVERGVLVRNKRFVTLCDHNPRGETPHPDTENANPLKSQDRPRHLDGTLQCWDVPLHVSSNVVPLRPRTAPSSTAALPSSPQKRAFKGEVLSFVPLVRLAPSPLHEVTS